MSTQAESATSRDIGEGARVLDGGGGCLCGRLCAAHEVGIGTGRKPF